MEKVSNNSREEENISKKFEERQREAINYNKILLGKENLGLIGKLLFKKILQSSSTERK